MSNSLNSVVTSQKPDGSWQAHHVPSDRYAFGASQEEAEENMKELLGMDESGKFTEPLTSERFSGDALDIAKYLEGPVSEMLAFHSGYARLESYENAVAHIRLGGGCQGCPSSRITLLNGVLGQLQDQFGEEKILDVIPVE